MFGFGARYCSACGMKMRDGGGVNKFGRDFCSEEHAQQYNRETKRARQVRLSQQYSQPRQPKQKNQGGSHKCH